MLPEECCYQLQYASWKSSQISGIFPRIFIYLDVSLIFSLFAFYPSGNQTQIYGGGKVRRMNEFFSMLMKMMYNMQKDRLVRHEKGFILDKLRQLRDCSSLDWPHRVQRKNTRIRSLSYSVIRTSRSQNYFQKIFEMHLPVSLRRMQTVSSSSILWVLWLSDKRKILQSYSFFC